MQTVLNNGHNQPSANHTLTVVERLGYQVLGLGGRRCVVALDDQQVAKLAWRRSGLADNQIEDRLYTQANVEIRALLCPVLDLTPGGVLIQARCLPVNREALPQSAETLLRQLASAGITDTAVNLGLFDEHLVCYDFCVLRADLMRVLLANDYPGPRFGQDLY